MMDRSDVTPGRNRPVFPMRSEGRRLSSKSAPARAPGPWLAAKVALALLLTTPCLADDGLPRRTPVAPGRTNTARPALQPVGTGAREGASTPGRNTEAPRVLGDAAGTLPSDTTRLLQNVALFGLVSLAPIGLLMLTAFVRINIVLTLLRQALGSPQVPGNQVVTALALLLTALVMWPKGEQVYHRAIQPYSEGKLDAAAAWAAGARPIKSFMVDQIVQYRHEDYLAGLYEYTLPPSPGQAPPVPERPEDFPLRVVMPAFLLSELTTALMMGFYIYLPFLVIDLVVSSVLAATGLFMLPPAMVATPVKLILFVLADGWRLVADMLLASFAGAGGG